MYACDPSPGEAKTGGTLEASAHQSIHVGKFQASERSQKPWQIARKEQDIQG